MSTAGEEKHKKDEQLEVSEDERKKNRPFLIDVIQKVGSKLLRRRYVNTIGLVLVGERDKDDKDKIIGKFKILIKVSDETTSREEEKVRNLLIRSYRVWSDRIIIDDSNLRRSLNEESSRASGQIPGDYPPIMSGESVGNLQRATKGTISGIVKHNKDYFLLSLEHILVGDQGDEDDDIVCQCLREIPDFNFSNFRIGKVRYIQKPKRGVEWCLSKLELPQGIKLEREVKPEIKEIGLIPELERNHHKIKIGENVIKYGVGTEITYGKISSIHVYASVEENEFLYGFEITRYEKDGKVSKMPFAGNSDSGSLVVRADKDFEPDSKRGYVDVLGILSLITEDQEGNELGFAIYADAVFDSISKSDEIGKKVDFIKKEFVLKNE